MNTSRDGRGIHSLSGQLFQYGGEQTHLQAGGLLEKAASRELGSKYYCVKDDGTFQSMVEIMDQIHCWHQKLLVFHALAFPMQEVIFGCSELPKPEMCAKASQYLGCDWSLAQLLPQELYAEPLRSTPI